jgi:hypothetical protein
MDLDAKVWTAIDITIRVKACARSDRPNGEGAGTGYSRQQDPKKHHDRPKKRFFMSTPLVRRMNLYAGAQICSRGDTASTHPTDTEAKTFL